MARRPESEKRLADDPEYQRISKSRRRMTRSRAASYRFGIPVALALARLYARTFRLAKVIGDNHLSQVLSDGKPFLPSCWHQHFAVCTWYMLIARKLGPRMTFLVSPSVDGEIGAQVLPRLGANVIRGSSTYTGARALKDVYQTMRDNQVSPLMTPDGPQGPPREFKMGTILLARLSGAPILPVAFAADRPRFLPTWDRLVVPKLFSRIVMAFGEPRYITETPNAEAMKGLQVELSESLTDLFKSAQAELQR